NLNLSIPANGQYSFHIAPGSGTTHRYNTSGLGTTVASNADAELIAGNRGTSLFHCTTNGGQATVKMVYSKGCQGPRVPVTATLTNAPAIAITSPQPQTICKGFSATLNVNSATNPNYSYFWTPVNVAGTSISVTPTNVSNDYIVEAIDTDVNSQYYGCYISDTTTVYTSDGPPALINPSTLNPVCPGVAQNLKTISSSGYTYQWYRNTIPIPGATDSIYSAVIPGSYTVIVQSNGCDSTAPAVVKTDHPLPTSSL